MTIRTRNIEPGMARALPPVQQTFAEVILGRRTAKCKHLGICKIENARTNNFLDYAIGGTDNRLYGVASLQEGVYFELSFSRSSISPTVYSKHFSTGYFHMEESYTAGIDFMGAPIYIPKGRYRIQFSDTMINIRFNF